jgi:all-trans-retinol 13,14-reductase
MHAIIVAHYFNGAAYPVGGASRIATSLLPTIERAGGAVVVSAEVESILLDGARAVGVRMKDGREFHAAAVVSDAGIRTTMERLLPQEGPVAEIVARTTGIPPSLAHLCLYVGWEPRSGTDRPGATNLWIHPGLDFDRNWSAFAADPEAPFPFLFISFPSAKDPSFEERHPGHETIEVISPAPYAWFSPWEDSRWKRRDQDYETFKQTLADRLLSALYQHVPAVAGAVTIAELSTPLSTRHFTNAAHGEIYGLAHTPARFESRDLQPRTPISQLFLTGQDVGTEGIVGALSAAVTTASVMLKRNLYFAIPKAVAA